MTAGVLLDRDGTIIVDYRYVGSPSRVQFIEGAPAAIRAFNQAGIPVAIVTNQSGIARGFYNVEDFWAVMEHIFRELELQGAHVDYLAFSPHHPDGVIPAFREASPDHKPAPGMAEKAAAEMGLDLDQCWVVGDRPEDLQLAQAVGAKCAYLGTPSPGWDKSGYYPFASLAAAAPFIIADITGEPMTETFPAVQMLDPSHYIDAYREEHTLAFRSIDPRHFKAAALAIQSAYAYSKRVFTCGNGGAALVANSWPCDHMKQIRHGTSILPMVTSLAAGPELLSAIANDIGFDAIFAYQLESLSEPGDVLVAFSASGNSPNIIRALEWGKEHGLQTISVTAFDGGRARAMADTPIHIKTNNYGIAEDIMQSVTHAIAQFIRQAGMSAETIRASRF